MIKIQKQQDLPNAFGRADLFGGKVQTGTLELKYLGKVDDNRFALGIKEVTVSTDETTMGRYKQSSSTLNMTTKDNYMGGYTTSGTISYDLKPEAKTYVLPPDVHDFVWDFSKSQIFEFEGFKVTFRSFDDGKIIYVVEKLSEISD